MKSYRSVFTAAAALALVPAVAFAQVPGESVLTSIADALTGNIARALAIIIIFFCGASAARGVINWGFAAAAIFAIVCMMGAAQIIDWVSSTL